MNERTRIGLAILPVAALGGMLGDELLRSMPWGLNVSLCTVALVAGSAWIVRARRLPVTPDAPWLAITALLCAVAFVRRDSPALQFLDLLGLILVLALGALSLQSVRLRLRGVTAYPLALLRGAGMAFVGSLPLLIGDITWADVPRPARMGQLRAVGLGVLLAVPLLAVFGALFASADRTFALVVRETFHFDPQSLFQHAFFILLWGALVAGYLRGTLLGKPEWVTMGERLSPRIVGLSFTTVATALGLLNLLFVIFLGLQALYGAIRRRDHPTDAIRPPTGPRLRRTVAYRQGLISNLSNPKIVVFFLSLFPQFVDRGQASFARLLLLGLIFCTITFTWLTLYAVVVARIGDFLRRDRVRRALEATTGLVLVGLGLRLATEPR